ncbi:MAG: hypothetical protein QG659_65 [Patescibacteria group bacterium]|nr:hypothetical protein [Patescibacteria group bacterium]
MPEQITEFQTVSHEDHIDVDLLLQDYLYVADLLAVTKCTSPKSYFEAGKLEQIRDSIKADPFNAETYAQWPLTRLTKVWISSELPEADTKEDLLELVPFVDEDSFDFAWKVIDRFCSYPTVGKFAEKSYLDMLDHLRFFISDTEGGYERLQADGRLSSLLHLYAAVEHAQVRDYEAALQAVDLIAEGNSREFLRSALMMTIENDTNGISEVDSENNLKEWAIRFGARAEALQPGPTKIATNRSLTTLQNLLDPYSNGRLYAAAENFNDRKRRGVPSSGDHYTRQHTEELLGHQRRLFEPRVAYGSVIQEAEIDSPDDKAWLYGDVRLVLREDSDSASQATFTIGDSLNGTQLNLNRILNRFDASRATELLKDVTPKAGAADELSRVSQYIEAQLKGVHLKDIEKVIIKHITAKLSEVEERFKLAELATLHGIDAEYLIDAAIIFAHTQTEEEVAKRAGRIMTSLLNLKQMYPSVEVVIKTRSDAERDLLSSLDHPGIMIQ